MTLIVLKQLPITEESKATLIDIRMNLFNDASDTIAEQLYTGEISIGAWEESMKQLIREVHASVAAIAKGGWDEMSWSDWGRLGTPLREQYKYLHGFAQAVAEKSDTISLNAIKARAHLYGQGAAGSAVLIQAGPELEKLLPYLPRDGSTECLMRCRCAWILEIVDSDKPTKKKVVEAVWTLGVAEHCPTCLDRDGKTVTLTVPEDTVVPHVIGGY
jgi:hypothetical protein